MAPNKRTRNRITCLVCGRVPGPRSKHILTKYHQRNLIAAVNRERRQKVKEGITRGPKAIPKPKNPFRKIIRKLLL